MSIHQAKTKLNYMIKVKREFVSKYLGDDERLCLIMMCEGDLVVLEEILSNIEAVEERDVKQSWRDSPDRMGGQFTDNEINGNEWR